MNTLFAAGLFDSPWVIAALVIGSALANWLSKRRQEKQEKQARQQGQQSEGEEPSPASSKPPGEFNLEETLRRLMGEEPPAPPLIPRAAQRELPPAQTWSAEEPLPPVWTQRNQTEEAKATARQPAKPAAPVLRPPIVLAPVSFTPRAASKQDEQAARRFEQLNEQGRHPATVVSHTRQRPSRSRLRGASRWRDVRSVRRAFAASLVFAPPKSFEP